MGSIFSWIRHLGPAGIVLKAIVGSLIGIGLLLAFILRRRTVRRRYFRRRDARTFALRKQWQQIVGGGVAPEVWRSDRMDREIVEAMLLDAIEVAPATPAAELPRLLSFLRSSGLLDIRIYESRASRGWRRQRALVSLGRMRVPEAIPAMAEGLESSSIETRAAAVRGLGRTGLPEAAFAILEPLMAGSLGVPSAPVQTALEKCCRNRPSLLVPYLRRATDETRALLARVIGELATPEMDDDLLLLAGDPLAEVRASSARALAEARTGLALPALTELAGDSEWFVRLRAVAGLGDLRDPRTIPALVAALSDTNRYVRLRAAASLARWDTHLEMILERVVETHDRYALHALISELERSGGIPSLVQALSDPARRHTSAAILLDALRAGSEQVREAASGRSGAPSKAVAGPEPEKVSG